MVSPEDLVREGRRKTATVLCRNSCVIVVTRLDFDLDVRM